MKQWYSLIPLAYGARADTPCAVRLVIALFFGIDLYLSFAHTAAAEDLVNTVVFASVVGVTLANVFLLIII